MTITPTLEQPVTINIPKSMEPEIFNQNSIDQLQAYYVLKEPEAVISFLRKFPFLIDLLWEAPEKIIKFFPDARLILQVAIDPESSSEDDDELVILIDTDIETNQAVERLDQLDDHWWLATYPRVQDKMFINFGA